jgi:hypothetical protein
MNSNVIKIIESKEEFTEDSFKNLETEPISAGLYQENGFLTNRRDCVWELNDQDAEQAYQHLISDCSCLVDDGLKILGNEAYHCCHINKDDLAKYISCFMDKLKDRVDSIMRTWGEHPEGTTTEMQRLEELLHADSYYIDIDNYYETLDQYLFETYNCILELGLDKIYIVFNGALNYHY